MTNLYDDLDVPKTADADVTVLERIDAAINEEVAQGRKPTKLILSEPERRQLDIEREGIVIWIRGVPIESGDGLRIVSAAPTQPKGTP
jgi:hypothetical protein